MSMLHQRDYYRKLAVDNFRASLREISEGRDRLQSFPVYLQVDLIGRCNMAPPCRMCVIDIDTTRAHAGLAPDDLRHLEPFLDRCSQVTNCSTGEPLVYDRLFDVLDAVAARGKVLGFSTNGLNLTREIGAKLLEYGESLAIVFSLDAATPDTYAHLRCVEWHRVITNIERFCAASARLPKERRPRTAIAFVVMRCNRHELPEFMALASRFGVDYVEVRPLSRLPPGKITRHAGFTFDYHHQMLSVPELEASHRTARRASLRHGVPLNWQDDISWDKPYALFRHPGQSPVRALCTMPWSFIVAFANGDTLPCCHHARSIGDWRKDGLINVWNSDAWCLLRRNLASGNLASACVESPSCPLGRRWANPPWRSGYLRRAHECAHSARFLVSDPDLQVMEGLHDEEFNPADGALYRWTTGRAIVRIPNRFPGQPFELGLHARCAGPRHRVRLRVQVNDSRPQRSEVTSDAWSTVWIGLRRTSEPMLDVRMICLDPWRPSQCGLGADERLLGIMVTEILLRPRRPLSRLRVAWDRLAHG